MLSALDAPGAAAAAAAGVTAAPTEAAAGPPVAGDTEAPSTENEPPLPPPATIPPEPDAPSAENEPSVARLQENGFTALPLLNKEVPAPSAPGNDGAPDAQEPVVHTTKAAKSVANVARAAAKAAAKAAADAAKAVAAKARELDAAEPTTKSKGRGKGKRPRAAAKPKASATNNNTSRDDIEGRADKSNTAPTAAANPEASTLDEPAEMRSDATVDGGSDAAGALEVRTNRQLDMSDEAQAGIKSLMGISMS